MRASDRKVVSIICLVLLAMILMPTAGFAEPAARWLLVIDTSMSMGSRSKNTEIVVHDLLASGMNGQMAAGDTLGVWTFNNQLHTGEVPLQMWSPQEARTIADRVTQYVAGLRYAKSTDLDAMTKEMLGVVQASDLITVLIISDADDAIKGTPFDAKINDYYKQHYRSQKKFKMPFITVLRGEKGKLTAGTVNLAQFTIDIPPIKREAPKPQPAPPKAAPKPVATLPPLIMSGKKPEPPTAPASAITAPVVPAQTNSSTAPSKSAPVVDAVPPMTTVTPTPVAAATLAESTKPVGTPAPVVQTPAAEQPKPAPQSTETHSDTVAVKTNAVETSAALVKPLTVAQTSAPATARSKVVSNAPPAQTAVAVTPQGFLSQRNLWIAGVLLVVIGFVAAVLLFRCSRTPHTSLITSSFDREKK